MTHSCDNEQNRNSLVMAATRGRKDKLFGLKTSPVPNHNWNKRWSKPRTFRRLLSFPMYRNATTFWHKQIHCHHWIIELPSKRSFLCYTAKKWFLLQNFSIFLLCSLLLDWPKLGKIVIHAQDLRILKSLGFEDPQILKIYLGINGLSPD